MRIRGKRTEEEASGASVARAALAGGSHEVLVREALRALTQAPHPDRLGIWLEPDANAQSPSEFSGAFQGLIWDRTAKEGCPLEWNILSLEPLPEHLLLRPEPFEQSLDESAQNAVIGQLVGLRRALWVPVADQGRDALGCIRGLILLGSVRNSLAPFVDRAKSVAAELALALRADEQFRAVGVRNAELDLVRRVVESRSEASPSNQPVAHLVEDCVRDSTKGDGLGASFAAIGVMPSSDENSASTQPDSRWRAGDEAWTRVMSTDPLGKLWRRALETRKPAGSEAPVIWPQASVARVVALPLETEGQLLGVLVAGFPATVASMATLNRLELRAQSLLDLVSDPLFLLDNIGRITATSRGARELATRNASSRGQAHSGKRKKFATFIKRRSAPPASCGNCSRTRAKRFPSGNWSP